MIIFIHWNKKTPVATNGKETLTNLTT